MLIPQTIPTVASHAGNELVEVMSSCFTGVSGTSEYNFMLKPLVNGRFDEQLAWLEAALQDALEDNGLDRGCIVFRRFFCSEAPGQVEELQRHAFSNPDGVVNGGVSLVIQPPAAPATVNPVGLLHQRW